MSLLGQNLKLKKLGIDTYIEAIAYIRQDSPICTSEGFKAQVRIKVESNSKQILVTLHMMTDGVLGLGELGLSDYAWKLLDAQEGALVHLSHAEPLESLGAVRTKIYGNELNQTQFENIITDITRGAYSDIHTASFLTACAGGRLSHQEIIDLTSAMINTGDRLDWKNQLVVDKHCIGGLPANRTTPIVVSIVARFGLLIPKSSSRAITSPAGTADTMEVLTNVDLGFDQMKKIVEQENGCLIWGGNVSLSPADDKLIMVERVMDLDSPAQLVASVLSKKISAGSSHIAISIPTGETTKVRNKAMADELVRLFKLVGDAFGLTLKFCFEEGEQPVGFGIGPCLEAIDVLSVLKNEHNAPQDLRKQSLIQAGEIIEFSPKVKAGEGFSIAEEILNSDQAWEKFQKICEAQGGLRKPTVAKYQHKVLAVQSGEVTQFDNRTLSRLAKLAGAPHAKAAGIYLHEKLNSKVAINQPLFTIHAESKGELSYALEYLTHHPEVVKVGPLSK
jgi:thymidine phosphorylase